MKHLYFVRHGESEHNARHIWSGQTETPLTVRGRHQAAEAAEHARELHIDYIVSSPYERALHTAQIIAKTIGYPVDKIELNDLLVERHFGSMEGQPVGDETNADNFIDAEPREAVIDRARQVLAYAESLPADNILIASHGSLGRALRHILHPEIPFTPGHAASRLPNGEIVQLV